MRRLGRSTLAVGPSQTLLQTPKYATTVDMVQCVNTATLQHDAVVSGTESVDWAARGFSLVLERVHL